MNICVNTLYLCYHCCIYSIYSAYSLELLLHQSINQSSFIIHQLIQIPAPEPHFPFLANRWNTTHRGTKSAKVDTIKLSRKSGWNVLTGLVSITRWGESWYQGWVSRTRSPILNYTHIVYLVSLPFMASTEIQRIPGRAAAQVLSGWKISSHKTYLMLESWHLDTTLMRHLATPLRTS